MEAILGIIAGGIGVYCFSACICCGLHQRKAALSRKEAARHDPSTVSPSATSVGDGPIRVISGGSVLASELPTVMLDQVEAQVPPSWKHSDLSTKFCSLVPVSDMCYEAVQQLVDFTYRNISTGDRGRNPVPERLKVVNVRRIENSRLWDQYTRMRRLIKDKRSHKCTPLSRLAGGEVLTMREDIVSSCATLSAEPMHRTVNEVFLWHGTAPKAADGIWKNGFDLQLAGSCAGRMYGDGVYFAECSSKSDEYARDDEAAPSKDGGDGGGGAATGGGRGDNEAPPPPPEGTSLAREEGEFCLLLCRAVLGEVLTLQAGGKLLHETVRAAIGSGVFESVLGDRQASVGTYREFVLYEEAQIYPAYLVNYVRETLL